MKSIQKILVPTDLSENSRRGLVYACSLAAENKGIVTILHIANEFDAWELYSDEFSFLEPTRRAWPSDRYFPKPISTSIISWNSILKP